MEDELQTDMVVRSLILNRNHMVCIPSDQGLTGAAFGKAKTIYYNNFEGVTQSKFYPETDNVKSYKNITNFVITPIVGHDDKPNGMIQLYSFKQPLNRLKIKKFIAMRKFIGGCLDTINLMNRNLETVMGAMTTVQKTMKAVIDREKEAESEQKMILEL